MSSPASSAATAEHKPFSLVEILIVLIIIGLMAAMSLPIFAWLRNSAREKAVLENLRKLDVAAQQYYLEQGSDTAPYEALVGPEKYIDRLKSVAGEDYSTLVFDSAAPGLSISAPKIKGGKVITLRRASSPDKP